MDTFYVSPGDDYLTKIGAIAYAISSLEWTVLGDLPSLAHHLPPRLTLAKLERLTAGPLATKFTAASTEVTEASIARYLAAAGAALASASTIRNDVLHARPATIDGQQRLYRWTGGRAPAFVITDDWLDAQLDVLAVLSRAVHVARGDARSGRD